MMGIKRSFFYGVIATCFVIVTGVTSASAAVVEYGIAWSGNGGYSLSGTFSFDNATAGPTVEAGELVSFEIEGFDGGGSLGTFSFPPAPENFNFDVAAGEFIVGGALIGPAGQSWNIGGPGIGFASDTFAQCLYLDGTCLTGSIIAVSEAALVATPLPAALPLFLSVLAGMGLLRWRRRRAATGGVLFGR